jgi:hypothetical protein
VERKNKKKKKTKEEITVTTSVKWDQSKKSHESLWGHHTYQISKVF